MDPPPWAISITKSPCNHILGQDILFIATPQIRPLVNNLERPRVDLKSLFFIRDGVDPILSTPTVREMQWRINWYVNHECELLLCRYWCLQLWSFEIIQSSLTKYEKILWYQTMFKIYCIIASVWYYKTKQIAIGDMNSECIKIVMKFKRKQSLNILRY